MPAALLPAPEYPEQAQSNARHAKADGSEPAQERAPITDPLPVCADDAQAKQYLADRLAVHAVKHDKIGSTQKQASHGQQYHKRTRVAQRHAAIMSGQT